MFPHIGWRNNFGIKWFSEASNHIEVEQWMKNTPVFLRQLLSTGFAIHCNENGYMATLLEKQMIWVASGKRRYSLTTLFWIYTYIYIYIPKVAVIVFTINSILVSKIYHTNRNHRKLVSNSAAHSLYSLAKKKKRKKTYEQFMEEITTNFLLRLLWILFSDIAIVHSSTIADQRAFCNWMEYFVIYI